MVGSPLLITVASTLSLPERAAPYRRPCPLQPVIEFRPADALGHQPRSLAIYSHGLLNTLEDIALVPVALTGAQG